MNSKNNYDKEKLNFVDLFAGCGGLSEGFLQAGEEKYFQGLYHVEWEMPMVEVLRARLINKWNHSPDDAKKRVVHFDIQKYTELLNGWGKGNDKYEKTNHEDIKLGLSKLIENEKKEVHLIVGGPPCQAYSIAGRAQDKNSMQDDYRNYLFESYLEVVKNLKPEVFVFENVPGILSACPGGTMITERIYKAIEEMKPKYSIYNPARLKEAVFNAADFGVPQNRKRVIIIGVRQGCDFTPSDIYQRIRKKLLNIKNSGKGNQTVEAAFNNLGNEKELSNKEERYHSPDDKRIFKEWIEGEWNKKTLEEKIRFYNVRKFKNSKHVKYRNLERDKPAPTIVAHLNKDGLMFLHYDPKKARSITVREAACLQSFDNDYEFHKIMGHSYKMIGNAVPPYMAKLIAEAIYEIRKEKNKKNDKY